MRHRAILRQAVFPVWFTGWLVALQVWLSVVHLLSLFKLMVSVIPIVLNQSRLAIFFTVTI